MRDTTSARAVRSTASSVGPTPIRGSSTCPRSWPRSIGRPTSSRAGSSPRPTSLSRCAARGRRRRNGSATTWRCSVSRGPNRYGPASPGCCRRALPRRQWSPRSDSCGGAGSSATGMTRSSQRIERRRAMSRWRPRGGAAALLLGLLAALGFQGVVAAHAELASSTPVPNSTLRQAPTMLVLAFTEAVDAASPSVELLDETGQPIAGVGPATPSGGDRQLTATLPILAPGVYEVSYRVTSAVDGHVTAGVFAFRFDPTGTLPPPTTAVTSSSPSADLPTIAARWSLLVLLLVLFGTALFWLVAARPASVEVAPDGTLGNDPGAPDPLPPPWRAMAVIGLAALAALLAFLSLSAAATGAAAAASRGGLPLDPVAPFGWTSFAIAMRIALVGVSAACVITIVRAVLALRATANNEAIVKAESLSLASLLACLVAGVSGLSFAGHAAANGGPVFAAVDALHLLSVAAWLGTLGGLALLAWRTRRLGSRREMLSAALARHSRVALVAAPAVALTGLANSPIVLGSARELVASDYGNLVVAKALLFSVAVAIGSVNFFLVRRGSVRRLAPLLAGEAAMGLLAIVAAATMLSIQPGVGRVPMLTQSTNQAAHVYLTAGSSRIHAAIDIPAPGDQLYEVAVADASGTPRTDVAHVVLEFRPPMRSGLAARRVVLTKTVDPAVWAVQGTFTPVLGEWTIGVIVERKIGRASC